MCSFCQLIFFSCSFFKWSSSFQFPLFLLHLNSDPTLISGFLVKLDFVLCDSHCISCCGYFLCDFLTFSFHFFKPLVIISICLTDRPNCVLFFVDFCVVFFFFFVCVCMCFFGHAAWHLGSNFSTKNGTRAPSSGSMSPTTVPLREFSMLCFRTDPHVLYF